MNFFHVTFQLYEKKWTLTLQDSIAVDIVGKTQLIDRKKSRLMPFCVTL